jgi:nicotinamidase-related amidase
LLENKGGRALLVIGMTNDQTLESSREIIPFIQGELQYFRDRMRPVIFCSKHANSEIIKELSPRTGELSIRKIGFNAFLHTDLAHFLRTQNISKLTLVGMQLHSSILLTAAAALEQNFAVVVPETCVWSDHEADHHAALRLINRWSKILK